MKSLLNCEFEMNDMRVVEKIMGMEIKRDRVQKKLFLYQKEQKVMNHFGMAFAKPVCTPLTTSILLFELNTTQSQPKKEYMSHVPYASVVCSLMYVMVFTRSNLASML